MQFAPESTKTLIEITHPNKILKTPITMSAEGPMSLRSVEKSAVQVQKTKLAGADGRAQHERALQGVPATPVSAAGRHLRRVVPGASRRCANTRSYREPECRDASF